MGNPFLFKFMLKRRSEERVRFLLSDDVLAFGWLEGRVNFPAFRMGLQRMPLWAVMLNIDHGRARSACFCEKGFNSGQNAPLDFGGHQFHQSDLSINDQQRCARLRRTMFFNASHRGYCKSVIAYSMLIFPLQP